ncbi:hypothetical protein [Streptomyces sp. NPDC090445]|uniref:hypothetical protein n=1 Tax=Streptomyces sp. NPDC090445 TaxID=3365963 RepID=UPI0037FCE971
MRNRDPLQKPAAGLNGLLGHVGADLSPHEVRAAAHLLHGPEPCRVLHGPGWALAAGRLSGDGGVTAAFHGDIDNRLVLFTRLEAGGHPVADRDTAAVVRSAYRADGHAFAARIDGAYAAAVVDEQAGPLLVLATDPAGATPLYYHWDASRGRLRFATQIPALLMLIGNRPALWEPGLDAYLTAGVPLAGRTLFDGIRALPPGTTALCSRSGLRLIPRTSPAAPADDPAGHGRRPPDLLGEVRRYAGGTAHGPACVLGSASPGAGLVAELATLARPELPAVPPPDRSGRPAGLDPARLPEVLPHLAWVLGQPDPDPAALITYAQVDGARREGFRTVLDAGAVDGIIAARARVDAAVAGGAEWLTGYAGALAPVPAATRFRLYSSDYRAYLADRAASADPGGEGRTGPAGSCGAPGSLAQLLCAPPGGGCRRAALTALELGDLLPARVLRRVAHIGGAHGVRARLLLPPHTVWSAAPALTGGRLPAPGAGGPLSGLLTGAGPLAGFVRDVLAPERLRASGLLDPVAVNRLLVAQAARPDDRRAATVWSLMMFELWREEYGLTPGSRSAGRPRRARTPAGLPAIQRRPPILS